MIPIYNPYLSKYKKSAHNAIDSEWISNYGIYVDLSSKKICELIGVNYCILMNNGTAATQCLFKALKNKYPDVKKIYVPNNTFIAPWNCALLEYPAASIEVMKMDNKTLNIDVSEEYIKSLDHNAAVVIVHNLGNIVNVPRLKRLRDDLIFIEDNCEGFLGKYENKYSGTCSLCASISFYANKTITSGEGGAFITNDVEIYKYIKNIYSHGMTEKRYIHNNLGYNFRMTNIQAALLYDQLNDIDTILNMKKCVFDTYDKLFEQQFSNGTIIKLKSENNTEVSRWLYSIVIPTVDYDDIEKYMTEKNVQIRPFFYDIREHSHLNTIKVDTPICETSKHGIMIPSYPELTAEQIEYIVFNIVNYIQTSKHI